MFVNKVTTNIKYFNCCLHQFYTLNIRHVSDAPPKTLAEKQLQKDLIQRHLDLTYHQSAAFIRNNPYLQSIDNSKLEDTLYALNKMGIKKEDVVKAPMALTLHYNTIEHNVMYLHEAGFNTVSAQCLLRFRSTVKKPIALLKAHGLISENINVPNRLFSYFNPKPLQFPLLDTYNDEDTILRMHAEIFKQYLVWRLDTSEEEINRIFKTYDKFKFRSFKLMSEMIQILTKELKFTKQKLLQHSYLFQVNPQYPIQLLQLFPTIADTDMKYILKRFPKIIAVRPENIAKTIDYLKRHNVPDESLRNCFEVFTLSPDTILFRLNEMKKIPEFVALKKNKRFVRLLFCYNKAKLRLDHLHELKVKNSTIHLLCAPDNLFEKFTIEGYDSNRGSDTINCLSNVFNLPVPELRKLFSQNRHWNQVPLVNIQDSLKFLRSKRFPIEEIQKLPVILLYSRNVIKEALVEMRNHPELHKVLLNTREQLNLCLYFIEMKYHFSGDGVWEDKNEIKFEQNDSEIVEDLVLQHVDIEQIKKKNLC